MQKVVDFLEKYCQWLAVGIAAIFFLFALWQYLPGLSTPVVATIDGTAYGPGEVDRHIVETQVESLQGKLASNEKIKDAVPPYRKEFLEKLATAPKTGDLPAIAIASAPIKIPPNMPLDPPAVSPDEGINAGQVAKLPALPSAIVPTESDLPPLPQVTTGFAQVLVNPPAPGAPPLPPPGPGVVPPPTKDVTWVRVPFKISMYQLKSSFDAVGMPPELDTGVIRVELIRQRQTGPGQWDKDELVETFNLGGAIQPVPPAGAPLGIYDQFKTWAFANQLLLLQPTFYTLYGGDDPRVMKPVEVAPPEPQFDPTTYTGPLDRLTPERRQQVLEARRRAAQERNRNRPTPGPRQPRGVGGGVPEGMEQRIGLPEGTPDASRPIPLQYRPPGVMNPNATMDESGTEMDPSQQSQAQPGQPIVVAPPPTAPFKPNLAGQGITDIDGYCYDVTAKSDATYRYRVRYSLYNPVFNTKNIAKPGLEQIFEIRSDNAEHAPLWTPPIAVAPRTYIFLAQPPQTTSTTVSFTVYRWEAGRQHKATVRVGPGDSIGQVANGVDFRTSWTLVEVRRDPATSNIYALLMNSEGMLKKQTFSEDKESPLQKRLQGEVDAANAAANVAAGGAAGGVGGTVPQ